MKNREFESRLLDAAAASQDVDRLWETLTVGEQIVAAHLSDGETAREIALNLGVTDQAVGGLVASMRIKAKQLGIEGGE